MKQDAKGCFNTQYVSLKTFLSHLSIFVLGIITFWNSYNGAFAFDDQEAILNNGDVTDMHSNIYELFFHDFWGSNLTSSSSHKSYRPLVVLTFRFQYWLFGKLWPTGFHVVNIILYSVMCTLFLLLFSMLFNTIKESEYISYRTSFSSFFCSLLFTVHPIHTENVSAIVGRADLMCSIFFTIAFISYAEFVHHSASNLKNPRAYCYLIAFAMSTIFSLLSKEQGITIFGICCIYEVIFEKDFIEFFNFQSRTIRPFKKMEKSVRFALARISLLVLFSVVLIVIRWRIMGSSLPVFQVFDNPHSFVENLFLRVLNYNYIYCLNAWLLINPWWLCFDWSMGCVPIIESFLDCRLFAAFIFDVIVALLFVSCFLQRNNQEKRLLLVSLSLLVVPFLPSSNLFFRVGFVLAERNLLISSSGFVMIVIQGMNKLQCHFKGCQIFMTSLLVCYFIRSVQRSSQWVNEETLFASGIHVCPLNAKVHYNVAKLAADKGAVDIAIYRYRLALKLNPSYDQALNNLGNLYKEKGNFVEAEACLTKAVLLKSDFATAWMNLGIVQATLKKFQNAEFSYTTALKHRNKYPDCFYNLGNLYLESGDPSRALSAWRNATLQNPNHISAWTNMLILLDSLGLFEDMERIVNIALTNNPKESSIYFNFANYLGKAGRYEESERNFLLAIKYKENVSNYHSNLGVLYHRWKKFDKAMYHYQVALELDPNNKLLNENFNLLKSAISQLKS